MNPIDDTDTVDHSNEHKRVATGRGRAGEPLEEIIQFRNDYSMIETQEKLLHLLKGPPESMQRLDKSHLLEGP